MGEVKFDELLEEVSFREPEWRALDWGDLRDEGFSSVRMKVGQHCTVTDRIWRSPTWLALCSPIRILELLDGLMEDKPAGSPEEAFSRAQRQFLEVVR